MTKSIETYETAALNALNNGFSSKAGAKAASDDVTRAYELAKRQIHEACLAADRDADRRMLPAIDAVYWDVPSYPHQFKAKHVDLIRAAFGDRFDDLIVSIERLVELRETIKAATIVPPAKDETKVLERRVVEAIKDRMDRLNVRYLEAIDLCTVFPEFVSIKGLTANSHYVTNDHGTTFLRTFYYLFGKLTPLNLILAAAGAASDKAKAA